jgi:hypothetical protein
MYEWKQHKESPCISYLHLKLVKMLWLSFYFMLFSSTKSEQEGGTGSAWKWWGLGDKGEGGLYNVYASK